MLRIKSGKHYRDGHGRLRGPMRPSKMPGYEVTDGNRDYTLAGEFFRGVRGADNLVREASAEGDEESA